MPRILLMTSVALALISAPACADTNLNTQPVDVSASTSVSTQPLASVNESADVVVQEAQSSYGSGSAAPAPKAAYGSGTNGAQDEKAMMEKAMMEKGGSHAAFSSILGKYVSAPDGQGLTHFNYGGLKANRGDKAALDNYIKSLEAINPNSLPKNEAIAYYANLYNAVTVQVVVDNYPIKSIKKLGPLGSGPWKKNLFTINGAPASLNNVEHDILRKQFPSPYVHYMVNCASVGCPNLLNTAWEASSLDRVKQKAASDYINSPRGVQITPKGLKVSSIFKWFKGDFGGNEGLLRHIRQYARPELARAIDNGAKVVGDGYDWSLNE